LVFLAAVNVRAHAPQSRRSEWRRADRAVEQKLVTDAIAELRKQPARLNFESLASRGEPIFDPADDLLALSGGWLSFFLGRHRTDLQLLEHSLPHDDGIAIGKIATNCVQRDFALLGLVVVAIGAV
jgi:hypothetical protein